jgi:RNA-directed DNA polymerase
MKDRAMQALHLLALDPIAETTADPNSYGFRQGRSTADAISQCYCDLAKRSSAQWVLEADIKACFDELSHPWMLTHLPMDRGTLRKWLKAGYVEQDGWQPTATGAPQGGIISPALCHLTLDGLERALQERFTPTEKIGKRNQVHLVRYADDFIITSRTKELLAEEVTPVVERFLAERGLALSPTKTRITHIAAGFDFLGVHVRKYDGKLLIKPSHTSVQGVLTKIGTVLKRNLHTGVEPLIGTLNPIITGWANDHRPWVSKETFAKVGHEIDRNVWRWAKRKHPTKRSRWLKRKYFSASATRSWAFGVTRTQPDGKHHTVRLADMRDTRIRRHIKIRSQANPYDPH